MIETVRRLISADEPGRELHWQQIVLHRNHAPLPPPHPIGDFAWNRGFDFLVLDERGARTHFGRCRPGDDARAAESSAIRERLSDDPSLSPTVPRTRCHRSGELLVEISRFVDGRLFELDVPDLDDDAWAEDTRGILDAVRKVTGRAAELLPGIRPADNVSLADTAGPALRYLTAVGLAPERAAAIERRLHATGTLTAQPQHGDLWPGNVIRDGQDWVLLDYEVFGNVQVPLYDAMHLLRACAVQRSMARTGGDNGQAVVPTWVEALRTAPDAALARTILREEATRAGLTDDQVVGAAIFYLVDITAKIRGREGPRAFWEPFWRDLEALADHLGDPGIIADLLLGPVGVVATGPVAVAESTHLQRVGRHGLIYGLGILLSKAVAFIMLPVYTRYLSTAGYGTLQLMELTFEIVSLVAGERLGAGIFYFYHRARSERERREVLATTLLLMIMSFCVAGGLAFLAAPGISRLVFGNAANADLVRIASLSLAFQSFLLVPFSWLQVRERSWQYVGFNAGKLVLQLTLNIVLVVKLGMGAKGVLLSTLTGNLVIGVLLAATMLRDVGLHFSWRATRHVLKFSLPLVATQIGTFVSTYGDRFFLQRAANTAAVGIYGLAYQFGFLLATIGYLPWDSIWDPIRFEIAKRPDRDELYARGFIYFNVVFLTIALIISLFVHDFLRLMADVAFLPAAALVPVILFAYVLQGWTDFLNLGLLITERTRYITIANWIAAAVAIACYMLMIPRWHGMGAAAATVVAFAVRFAMVLGFGQHFWPVRYRWGPVLRLLALAVSAVLLNTQIPDMEMSIVASFGVRVVLLGLYAVGVWNLGILREGDRELVRRIARNPRGAVADLRELMLTQPEEAR